MLALAIAGLFAALASVVAMSGVVMPLHGASFEMASVVFLVSALFSTLGFAAADG